MGGGGPPPFSYATVLDVVVFLLPCFLFWCLITWVPLPGAGGIPVTSILVSEPFLGTSI